MDAEIAAKFDAVLLELHDLKRLVCKLTVPVEVLTTEQTAGRLGCSVRSVERLYPRGVFTDARSPDRRTPGSPRLNFADEITVYQTDGIAGVRRLRKELGRL